MPAIANQNVAESDVLVSLVPPRDFRVAFDFANEAGTQAELAFATSADVLNSLSNSLKESKTSQTTNLSLSMLDAVLLIGLSANDIYTAQDSKYRCTEKTVLGITNLALAIKLLASHGLTLLAQYTPAICQELAPIFGGIGGGIVVISSYIAVIKSAIDLYRTIKKQDSEYLFENRINKIKNLDKKILKLTNGAKKDSLLEIRERLLQQAEALAAVSHSKKPNLSFYQKQFNIIGVNKQSINPATDIQRALVSHLKIKQSQKVRRNVLGLVMRTITAVGATLALGSFIFPPLLIPAIVLTSISTLYFLGRGIGNAVLNYTAKKKRLSETKQNLVNQLHDQDKHASIDTMDYYKTLSDSKLAAGDALNEKVVTGLYYANRLAEEKGLDPTEWKKIFLAQPAKKQKAICKNALKEAAKRTIISEYLKENGLHAAANTETLFSEKDSERILEMESRRTHGFFTKKPVDLEDLEEATPKREARWFASARMKLGTLMITLGALWQDILASLMFVP